MGCLGRLEIYLNLSRKELQGLCKKHNLPANRSHFQLAKSLTSFFEKKNANVASSKETSTSHLKDSFHISFGPGSKSKETSYHPKQTRRDVGTYEGRTDSSKSDSCRLTSSNKETVGDDRQHHQTGNQLENNIHTDSQTLKKAYDTAVEVVYPHPVNSEATKGFGCCTSEPGDVGMISLSAPGIQEKTANPQHGIESHNSVSKSESQKSSPPKISHHKMLKNAATNSRPSSLPLFPCREQITIACSTESGLMSSYEVSKKAAPSLQFFAASEKGINLYVDLNSSPSEWINSMTDELCIYKKGHPDKSKTPSNHIRGLADVDEHMKTSVSGFGMNVQSNRVERNTGCTNSSLSSVVSETCHSEASAPDGTAVSSRSCLLTSSSLPVEITVCSEGNQVIPSSCITYTNVQDQIASNIASCLGDGKASPADSVDASFRIEKSKASVLDNSLNSISNMDLLTPDETKYHVPTGLYCLKTTVNPSNVGVRVSGNTPISISENHSLPMPDEIQNKMEVSDIRDLEKNFSACQASVETARMDEITEVTGHQKRPSYSCQLDGEMVLDNPATDAQSDVGSANHLLNQHENSVTEDPISIFDDELGRSIAVNEIEQTDRSKFQNSVGKSNKRPHSSEFSEDFRSKKQRANNINQSGIMMNLRSTKTWAKETICDHVVLPRRSTRLVSK